MKESNIEKTQTAVVTIDIQMDYFWGGRFPLWRAHSALRKTRKLLDWARSQGVSVIHVQHFGLRPDAKFLRDQTEGTALHPGLAIQEDEVIVSKHFPNSFRDTNLELQLRNRGIDTVIWAGMITWMCVDTTVRSAFDLGFKNILIKDATAAGWMFRKAGWMPIIITPWRSQSAFLAAIGFVHARVLGLSQFLRIVT